MPLVFKYGLLTPTVGRDTVEEQLRFAHRYRNELVRVERDRRAMVRQAEEPYGIRALEGRLKELRLARQSMSRDGIQKAKAKEDKKAATAIGREMSEVKAVLQGLRETPELAARMLEINGKPPKPKKAKGEKVSRSDARKDRTPNNGLAAKAKRAARAGSGVFWGTYLCVEAAAGQSFGEVPWIYDGEEDNDPRFVRWTGEGQLAVQIQSARPLVDVFGNDARVSIAPVDELALTSPVRSERRKAARTTLRMAIAGNARGKSEYVYAEWPMIMHRPLPNGGIIKWVKVSKRMVGPRVEWSCEITIDVPSRKPTSGAGQRDGVVAVVFGWRKVDENKVRVAHWMSSDGTTGALDVLDADLSAEDSDGGRGGIIDGLRRSNTLRSTRDKNFNEALTTLVEWLKKRDSMPEWMLEATNRRGSAMPSKAQATAHIAQWRSQARLAGLVKVWGRNRFDGDEECFATLEAWRYHDFHLWQWERSQETNAKRRRREVYRRFAAHLARRFGTIIVDGTDYKEVKETEPKGGKRGRNPQTMGQMVACGELRDIIKNAASTHGSKFEKATAKNTATQCPKCGATDNAHRGDKHMFACAECPFVRDVATVRLLNMLQRAGYKQEVESIIKQSEQLADRLQRKAAA